MAARKTQATKILKATEAFILQVSNHNSYLLHGIIDRFPQIENKKIMRLIQVLSAPTIHDFSALLRNVFYSADNIRCRSRSGNTFPFFYKT